MTIYNNIPRKATPSSTNATVKFFNNYYKSPIEIDGATLTAITGFFEARGFGSDAAESVAIILVSQAKRDNLNAYEIINTLSGLNSIRLSSIVGEVLNYNRFKTSSLGVTAIPSPADEIQRNILA